MFIEILEEFSQFAGVYVRRTEANCAEIFANSLELAALVQELSAEQRRYFLNNSFSVGGIIIFSSEVPNNN